MKRFLLVATLVLFGGDLAYGQCNPIKNGIKVRILKNKHADALKVMQERSDECIGDAEFEYLYGLTIARVMRDSNEMAIAHLVAADELNGDVGDDDELQANITQALQSLWGSVINQGVNHLAAGNLVEAEEKITLAVRIFPGGKEGFLALGALRQEQNEHDAAIEAYRRALEIDPVFKVALTRLAETYQTKADAYVTSGDSVKVAQAPAIAGQAVETYASYLADNPDDIEIQIQLGAIYAGLGDIDKVLPVMETLLSSDEVPEETYTDFGFRLANAGEYDLADRVLSRALEMSDSLSSEPMEYLVFVRVQNADLEGARAILEKQLSMEPANAEAWETYGFVLRDLGNQDEAYKAFEKSEQIPVELRNLSLSQQPDRTWTAQATFANRHEEPVEVRFMFTLVNEDGEEVEQIEAALSDEPLGVGEAADVLIEFSEPVDTAHVRYEIM